MFYQIKAIRKNTKPPIWRRILIPSSITFSQLAVILEQILEIPLFENFVFEFYSKKERLAEYKEGVRMPSDFYYTAFDAAETYVNSYLDSEKWFSFRIPDMEGEIPEYRLEIEKKISKSSVKDRTTGQSIEVSSPVVMKEVAPDNDRFFTDPLAMNDELRKNFFLQEGSPSFEGHSQIYNRISEGNGILYSNNPESRTTHVARSSQSYLKEMADKFEQLYEQNGEVKRDYITEFFRENIFKDPGTAGASSGELAGNMAENRHRTLEAFIKTFPLEDLRNIADDIGFETSEKNVEKLAKILAGKLLTEEVMKKQLFCASEEELDVFEEIIKEKGRYFDEAEWDKYDTIYDLSYYIAYDDNYVGVTGDVAGVYNKLRIKNYRDIHRQANWLYDCLRYASFTYVVMPVRQFYRIFRQREGMDIGADKIAELFKEIPADLNPCVLKDGRIISDVVIKNDLYKELEAKMADVGYFIPTVDNVRVFLKDYYPADEPAYRKLYDYYVKDLGWNEEVSAEMCHMAAKIFPMNDDISDYTDMLNEHGLSLGSRDDVIAFSEHIIDVHNNTRMFGFRGHTPNEMSQLFPMDLRNGLPTIVPKSSDAADILESGRNVLENMGINVDTDYNAVNMKTAFFPQGPEGNVVQMTKKIYPNDPCPCGSGKKFKKCCGAK